jgi:hypothetical protein
MSREKNKIKPIVPDNSISRQLVRLLWLLLIPLGYILPMIASAFPALTEKLYSSALYPAVSGPLGFVFSLFPFSAAELLIYSILIFVPFIVIVYFIRFILKKISGVRLLRMIITLCMVFGILFNAFYFQWGFNYSRPTLGSLLGLNTRPRPEGELEELCYMLADRAIVLRDQVNEDENGIFYLPEGYREHFLRIPEAYRKLGSNIPFFSQKVYPAKSVLNSKGLSYSGISGIYIPFTAEPNVNIDQPPLLLLSSAAHESAHFIGVAREDEANFVAYLACIQSDDPAIEYSGIMLALVNAGNKLNSVDHDAYTELRKYYSEGMTRDISDYKAYWADFEGPVEEAASNLNDSYLKFNGQEDGVKSYGAMVDLLLAYYY